MVDRIFYKKTSVRFLDALMVQPSGSAFAVSMQARWIGAERSALSGDEFRAPHPPFSHVLPSLPIRRSPRLLGHLSTFAGVFSKLVQ
ncbi:MAG: hypothetical protein ACLPKB_28985 [Xanthobacteraceae bacterium]